MVRDVVSEVVPVEVGDVEVVSVVLGVVVGVALGVVVGVSVGVLVGVVVDVVVGVVDVVGEVVRVVVRVVLGVVLGVVVGVVRSHSVKVPSSKPLTAAPSSASASSHVASSTHTRLDVKVASRPPVTTPRENSAMMRFIVSTMSALCPPTNESA